MQTGSKLPIRRRIIAGAVFAAAGVYIVASGLMCAADLVASRPGAKYVRLATRLDPWEAEYWHRLGRYYDLVAADPSSALMQYQRALKLNPRDARYWLDLAAVYRLLGDSSAQANAIERAVEADSKTPDVAWEAANLYVVQGQDEKALREFRIVMEGAPYMSGLALQTCWHVNPDVDVLLRDVIPPRMDAYQSFLTYLMSKEETDGTVKVWNALVRLQEPMGTETVFSYVRYLLLHKSVDEASRVWRQSASLLGLSEYLSSSNNLIVNGSFNLAVLNGGFDWQYHKDSSVSLALDPSEFHSGNRSLSMSFDGPGVQDAGIYQVIPVQPNTTYEFSGYYKNGQIEGAGGLHFALQDVYTAKTYYLSEELRDGVFWKSVSGAFSTGPETQLVVLRVQRLPAGSPIRGKLWIDDLRLVEVTSAGSSS